MKGIGRLARALGAAAALVVAAPACVDLFHSTDFETLCDIDANACPREGGAGDAAPDRKGAAPIDFCSLGATKARSLAEHACAWLGACSVPFDHNAFGRCMVDALLAFDCELNPNAAVVTASPLHALWQGLATATSCADVAGLVNPEGLVCNTKGYSCEHSVEPSTVIECAGGVSGAEPCLVQGRVCGIGACEPPQAKTNCKASSCDSKVLHDCEAETDLGYDCTSFGGGDCFAFDGGAACAPGGATTTCSESFAVTCAGGKATSCPGGRSIGVDCAGLGAGVTCRAGTPSPLWNVAGRCEGSGICIAGCSGDTLKGCAQGIEFTLSCKSVGLGPCEEVALPTGKGFACKGM